MHRRDKGYNNYCDWRVYWSHSYIVNCNCGNVGIWSVVSHTITRILLYFIALLIYTNQNMPKAIFTKQEEWIYFSNLLDGLSPCYSNPPASSHGHLLAAMHAVCPSVVFIVPWYFLCYLSHTLSLQSTESQVTGVNHYLQYMFKNICIHFNELYKY